MFRNLTRLSSHASGLFASINLAKLPIVSDKHLGGRNPAITLSSSLQRSFSDDIKHHDYLRYVSKNTYIPSFIRQLNISHSGVRELYSAIQSGNPNASVFRDPDCYLYAMYLSRMNAITNEEAMTIHVYLMSLMQFTQHQPVADIDSDVKSIRHLTVHSIVVDGEVTAVGRSYLEQVVRLNKTLDLNLNINEMMRFVKSLRPVEQWLIEIRNPNFHIYQKIHNQGYLSADELKLVLYATIFLIGSRPEVVDVRHPGASILVPSTSFINYYLSQHSADPLKMVPIFGKINSATLRRFHAENRHPVAFYSPHVLSNMETVHQYRGGPFFNWLHDIGHVVWASMLTRQQRAEINHVILPRLDRAIELANAQNDIELSDRLRLIGDQLNDYDLTPIQRYSNPMTRYEFYLRERCTFEPKFRHRLIHFTASALDKRLAAVLYDLTRDDIGQGRSSEIFDNMVMKFAERVYGANINAAKIGFFRDDPKIEPLEYDRKEKSLRK